MIDLEQEVRKEIEQQMAKNIQEEIDFSIIADILKESGWTKVTIDRFTDNHHAIDIREWLSDSVKPNDYRSRGSTFLFKDARQATMFILRWGGEVELLR